MRIIILISLFILTLVFFLGCDRKDESIEDPGIPPAVPTGIRISYASDGEIVIEWSSNPEPDVKGYNIYRRTDSTESGKIAYATENFFFDDSLFYDTTYYYKVTSINLWDRESSFSNEVSAKPENRENPGKPIGLNINARNWENEISIYIHWRQNFETDVEGYEIYRSTTSGFTPDNDNLIGFSNVPNFSDTLTLNFYQDYYYKIKARDRGGLLSTASDEVNDLIFEIPEVFFPPDNSFIEFFDEFIIKTINVTATYRIGFQTNRYFGEIWNTSISSANINDTLKIRFNPPSLQVNRSYFWRISTFSGNSADPNSISELFSVTFKE